MSLIYEGIGRLVVRLGIGRLVVRLAWWRFSGPIKIAGAVGLVVIGVAGYLAATREPPEG